MGPYICTGLQRRKHGKCLLPLIYSELHRRNIRSHTPLLLYFAEVWSTRALRLPPTVYFYYAVNCVQAQQLVNPRTSCCEYFSLHRSFSLLRKCLVFPQPFVMADRNIPGNACDVGNDQPCLHRKCGVSEHVCGDARVPQISASPRSGTREQHRQGLVYVDGRMS